MGQPIDFPYNSEDEIFDPALLIATLNGVSLATTNTAESKAATTKDKKKELAV